MTRKLDKVRDLIEKVRHSRIEAEELTAAAKGAQSEVLPLMEDIDPDNHGIVVTDVDGSEVAAFYQQNSASEYWDQETLIEWLKDEGLWQQCSVRVFDQTRFESLIQNGQISAKKVAKFRKVGNAPAPFVRFGKPKKESLR